HNVAGRNSTWNNWAASIGCVPTNRIEVFTAVPAGEIAALIDIPAGEKALVRHRVRLLDGGGVAICDAYFPRSVVDGTPLAEEGSGDAVDMVNPTPLAWLAQNGWTGARTHHEITARAATYDEKEALGIDASIPVIVMYTTSHPADVKPIRCTVDILPASRFTLTVTKATAP